MIKSLLIATSLSASLVAGSVLWNEIQPNVESTVSYTSVDNVLKNASFLRDLGTKNPVETSYLEVKKQIPNLVYFDEAVKYQTETSCYVGILTPDYYQISEC